MVVKTLVLVYNGSHNNKTTSSTSCITDDDSFSFLQLGNTAVLFTGTCNSNQGQLVKGQLVKLIYKEVILLFILCCIDC